MSRPRVLHVGKYYPPVKGGMEQVLAALCAATRAHVDNQVLVFSGSRRTSHEVVDGIPVTRLGTISPARSIPIAPAMIDAVRRADADVIVVHEPNPWALVSCALARPGAPLAIYYHSEVVRPALQYALFYHPLVRAVYSRAAAVIVASPPMAEHPRALRPYRDRVTVIPYGVDPARWALSPAVDTRRAELRHALNGRPLVLFAGRMVPYKGCDVLLRALAGTEAAAVLVGEGPVKPDLMRLSNRLQLEGRVTFAGELPHEELAALYHAADVVVLPSVTRAEAFGFVQVEAMACGTPVISTRLPSGAPWVNQHGVTGLVVEPADVRALQSALDSLLADPPTRARMGAAGRRRVAEEFSLERIGQRAGALFTALAARGKESHGG